jgi:predicted amidohydrolase
MSTTIVAAVQLQAGRDLDANLEQADRLVRRAAARGAEIVLLPEKWNGLGSAADLRRLAEPLGDGPSTRAMAGWASELGISLIGGSITDAAADGVLHNTCAVFDPAGEVVAVYRKMHMFDVDVGDHVFRESDNETAGSTPEMCALAGWPTGLSICYDLRFPELYRRYADAGARLLSVPAAFTLATGKDHWELLLRARAVENQCFVVAAGQWGLPDGQPRYGRSMIVDAWGVVLAQAADGDAVVVAEIDSGQQDAIRTRLPALAHRRRDLLG